MSDHFNGETFINQRIENFSVIDVLLWKAGNDRQVWQIVTKNRYEDVPPARVANHKLNVTFVNHATVLLQYDGINVLTDPVWSNRISPVSFIGPHRKRKPGIKFEDLPPIDVVVLSHNHYDHMDMPTLKKLKKDHDPLFIVPLGNKKLMDKKGLTKNVELDWWDEYYYKEEHKITLVPAEHFSMRGLCDRNTTLWGGYMLESRKGNIFFAGDTGFSDHFQEIKDRFGEIYFSLIPIAPIEPRWLMEGVHLSPEEAVKAHLILKSKKSMGIHFGTFQQADDPQTLAIELLRKALIKYNVGPQEFMLLPHGKLYDMN